MPENAPVIVLLFLLTLAILAAATALVLWSLGRKRLRQAGRILEGMAVLVVVYAGTLLTFSLTSPERILEPGQQKYLCEVDCHLAYSVASVTTARALGSGRERRTARGLFHVITVRTWFDESTVSPQRGSSPLWPSPRWVVIADEQGRSYPPSRMGLQALESEGRSGIPLDHPLRPGEFYSTSLVFDLPPEVEKPRLLIAENLLVTRFLIGHENSFQHKKTWFEVGSVAPERSGEPRERESAVGQKGPGQSQAPPSYSPCLIFGCPALARARGREGVSPVH
jgi:hypothetical protein